MSWGWITITSSRHAWCSGGWKQLALARNGLPVILHNRESDHDLMRIVDGFRGVRGCFIALGDHNLRDWALEHGLYLVWPDLTFPKMEELRRCCDKLH